MFTAGLAPADQAVMRAGLVQGRGPGQRGSWKGHGWYLETGSCAVPESSFTASVTRWVDKL